MIERQKTLQDLRREFDRMNDEIKLLEAKGENLSADLKVTFREQVIELHKQRDKLSDILTQVQDGGEDLIERLSQEYEIARGTLETSIREIQEKYKDS